MTRATEEERKQRNMQPEGDSTVPFLCMFMYAVDVISAMQAYYTAMSRIDQMWELVSSDDHLLMGEMSQPAMCHLLWMRFICTWMADIHELTGEYAHVALQAIKDIHYMGKLTWLAQIRFGTIAGLAAYFYKRREVDSLTDVCVMMHGCHDAAIGHRCIISTCMENIQYPV